MIFFEQNDYKLVLTCRDRNGKEYSEKTLRSNIDAAAWAAYLAWQILRRLGYVGQVAIYFKGKEIRRWEVLRCRSSRRGDACRATKKRSKK